MIFALIAVLLVLGALAFVAERKRSQMALRELQSRLEERLAKAEASIATKAEAKDVANLSIVVEGGLSVSRRIERRVADLERPDGPSSAQP